MSLPVIVRPLAEADVVEIFGDLDFIRSGLGKRFIARLREVLDRIEWMPEVYGTTWQDIRAVKLQKFSYILLRDIPGSGDDAVWKSRL